MTKEPAVLILFNRPDPRMAPAGCIESDRGVLDQVDAVEHALRDAGHPCRRLGIRRLDDLPRALAAGREPVVFNLVEHLEGSSGDFNLVPAVCRAMGRSCTGGDTASLLLTFDKALTKARLASRGIPTPGAAVVERGHVLDAPRLHTLPCPCIVKPVCADGSEGIDSRSLVRRRDIDLTWAIRRVHRRCRQAALVERYIGGREFNVSVFQDGSRVRVLPLAEIDFTLFPADRPHIVDYAVKWKPGTIPGIVSPRRVPARVDAATARLVRNTAVRSWLACGCRDYARIDMRLSPGGRLYVLEVNINPDISPKASLPATLAAAGIPFARFVTTLVRNAIHR